MLKHDYIMTVDWTGITDYWNWVRNMEYFPEKAIASLSVTVPFILLLSLLIPISTSPKN